jgi:hypothetical protein
MKGTLAFAVGFATGWLTRSTLDAAKPATVQIVAFGLDVAGRVKRALAIEREQLEDLIAEAQDAVARRREERAERAERAEGAEHTKEGAEVEPVGHAA